ncbi:MAG: hypothetical protein WD826_11990, partial [Actinomycetota bacterium]
DFPFSTFGEPGDLPFRLHAALTSSDAAYSTAVDSLSLHNGEDTPGAQYAALWATATGSGLSWPDSSTAASPVGFRSDAIKMIVFPSDLPFHNDDRTPVAGTEDPYSGFTAPTGSEAITALNASGIRVVAVKNSSVATANEMDDLATATGGLLKKQSDLGILVPPPTQSAPGDWPTEFDLSYDLTAEPQSCDPLELAFDPVDSTGLAPGDPVTFDGTITLPAETTEADVDPEQPITCSIDVGWSESKGGSGVLESRSVTVHAQFPTTLTLSPRVKKTKIKAKGTLSPAHPVDTPISVALYRKKNGNFQLVVNSTAYLDAESKYAITFFHPAGKKCRLIATFTGDEQHTATQKAKTFAC